MAAEMKQSVVACLTVAAEDTMDLMTMDPGQHRSWRVALYYCYIDLSNVPDHVEFHRHLCKNLSLKGRIRVSSEGLNGVLTGQLVDLKQYEDKVLKQLLDLGTHQSQSNTIDLNIKYCFLREDLPILPQLFDKLICKETSSVICLFDNFHPAGTAASSTKENRNSRSKQNNRRVRRKKQRQEEKKHQSGKDVSEEQVTLVAELPRIQNAMMTLSPSQHLTTEEWNVKLQNADGENALLLDVRNVYESRVGHFSVSNVPTLLTNTRKYSDLPELLAENPNIKDKEEVFMYCTGGVRCERVSMMMQAMYPQTKVYQLKGGIQTYLQESDNKQMCLFKGKNFVFDPRRTDPVHRGETVGRCLICEAPHDDYDNGHAPSENKEARCNTCRMLVLVCNQCRSGYLCWGESEREDTKSYGADLEGNRSKETRPWLYCAIDRCVHEGAKPQPELLK
ncbi:unnamed protein product [Cylindrotheca closterium]|uniref:Rhodanese domain-containing protein n=1 Tax=Cylindrotheca closterium TaxID=2856 RepID=A0AAD2FZ95_9STRA|nr:unnamed protein product [Cylindrotheca closterium]